MVSSMVSTLWSSGNSNISADRSELFPAPRGPHTRIVALLSTRNERSPAADGVKVPLATSLLRVHGLDERFLIATAVPLGLSG